MTWTGACGLFSLLLLPLLFTAACGQAEGTEAENGESTILPRTMVPFHGLKRPFRRESNSVVKPLANFATGLVEKDKIWMLLPWRLGEKVYLPVPEADEEAPRGVSRPSTVRRKKVFLGAFPYKMQGGEMQGFAMAEMACREAGESLFGDGGFRALLTSHHRPLDRILPRHLAGLPVVNLRGETLAESWYHFLIGRLTNNTVISMEGTRDSVLPRWKWKYYWLGDGYRRTCDRWTSSYLMDVANVFAFDYANNAVVHDVASCSSKLHLLCYSICEDYDQFL